MDKKVPHKKRKFYVVGIFVKGHTNTDTKNKKKKKKMCARLLVALVSLVV